MGTIDRQASYLRFAGDTREWLGDVYKHILKAVEPLENVQVVLSVGKNISPELSSVGGELRLSETGQY
jgi:hypothetical protein